jgi:nicotinamide-nucleotide adenylyltransferase
MIRMSLSVKTPYEFVSIPDFDDDGKWMGWIGENIRFDAYMTNSRKEAKIFRDAGYTVLPIPFFERDKYSATEVRKKVVDGGDYRCLIPEGTISVLDAAGGVEKIKSTERGGR